MEVIRDRDGNVISRSRNMRGIRRYVSDRIIKRVAIGEIGNREGKLMILFEDGSSYETNFASWGVLRQTVRQWRNLYGAPLQYCDTHDAGTVHYYNMYLE